MDVRPWVEKTLTAHMNEAGEIILGEEATVPVDTFCTLFGASIERALAEGGSVYAALTGPQVFTWEGAEQTATGEELGYLPYLDQWHAEGLI
jgi:hypothetical protein